MPKEEGAIYTKISGSSFLVRCEACWSENVEVTVIHFNKVHVICLECGNEVKI